MSTASDSDGGFTDRTVLTGRAYRTEHDLAARQSLYRWQAPRYDLPTIVREELAGVSGTVVDVGCGNGRVLERLAKDRPDLRAFGLDISLGILRGLTTPVAVADAARLPLAAASVEAALAMHMLYHVADIPAAVRELARVLRPDGLLIVSTNSSRDKAELDQLWQQAAGDVLGVHPGPHRVSLSTRFPLELAAGYLRAQFGDITTIQLPGTISVTTPEPVTDHLQSYRAWATQHTVPFAETIARARDLLIEHIAGHGRFDITCLGGILICARTP